MVESGMSYICYSFPLSQDNGSFSSASKDTFIVYIFSMLHIFSTFMSFLISLFTCQVHKGQSGQAEGYATACWLQLINNPPSNFHFLLTAMIVCIFVSPYFTGKLTFQNQWLSDSWKCVKYATAPSSICKYCMCKWH